MLTNEVTTFSIQVYKTASSLLSETRKMACQKVEKDSFGVLKVTKRTPLKKFLESKKISFEKGRTFYEMTKSEIIQDYKVLVTM